MIDTTAPLPQRIMEYGVRRNARVVLARLRATAAKARIALGGRQPSHQDTPYGVKLMPNFGDKTFRYCRYGTYGMRFADYLTAQRRDFSFVDIGANQGLFSLVAGRNPCCRAIVAFEPVPQTHAILSRNLALNGLEDRAVAICAGVSDHSGEARIAVKEGHSGVATLARSDMFDAHASQTVTLIDADELDRLLPQSGALIVKVDVEGHEQVVIEQLLRSRHAPRIAAIFYEMDQRWCDHHAVRKALEGAGFDRFAKLGVGRHYDMLAQRATPPG